MNISSRESTFRRREAKKEAAKAARKRVYALRMKEFCPAQKIFCVGKPLSIKGKQRALQQGYYYEVHKTANDLDDTIQQFFFSTFKKAKSFGNGYPIYIRYLDGSCYARAGVSKHKLGKRCFEQELPFTQPTQSIPFS